MTSIVVKMPLCPEIVKRHQIITSENMNSLNLTTYRRTPGTNVSISCLVPTLFDLIGKSFLKCLPNGQWNNAIPVCVRSNRIPENRHLSDIPGIILPGTTTGSINIVSSTAGGESKEEIKSAVPYLIIVSVLALMFLCLICLLLYLVKLKQNMKYRKFEMQNRPAFVKAVESLQSIPSLSSTAYDYYRNSGSPVSGSSTRSSRHAGSTHHQDPLRSSSLQTGRAYQPDASQRTESAYRPDGSRSSSHHTGYVYHKDTSRSDYHHIGRTSLVKPSSSNSRNNKAFETEDDNFHSIENLEF